MADEVYKADVVVDVIDHSEPELTRIRSKVAGLEKQAMSMTTRMRSWGRGFATFGRTMTRWVSAPLLAAGAASIKMYADFEHSFTNIRSLVGIGGKQLATMRQQTLELGRTMPQGPQALADALYFVTSSGFKGASAMRVLTASAKASAAGLGETATVADAVTSAVNAYGEANLSAMRATDILLATVREGKAEPEALAASIGRVIAPAESLGMEFWEVGAALASLSLTGLDAAEGVTGLRGAMMTFMGPTEKTRKTLHNMGMEVVEIQKSIRDRGFMATMVDLRNEFGFTAEEAANLSKKPLGDLKASLGEDADAIGSVFGNVRALNAFLALTGRNMQKNVDIHHDLASAAGDTAEAYEKARKDPLNKFNIALAQLRTTAIEVAPKILPAAEKFLHVIEGWAKAIGRMNEDKLERIVKIAGALMLVGPASSLLSLGMRGGAAIGAGWRGAGRIGASRAAMALPAISGAGAVAGAGAAGTAAQGAMWRGLPTGAPRYVGAPVAAAPIAAAGGVSKLARAGRAAGRGAIVASLLAPFMPALGKWMANTQIIGGGGRPGTDIQRVGEAIAENEAAGKQNRAWQKLSKDILQGTGALGKYVKAAGASGETNETMRAAMGRATREINIQKAKLYDLGGELTSTESRGMRLAQASGDLGLASDIMGRALDRAREDIKDNGREAAGATIKFEKLEDVMERLDGMTIKSRINLIAMYGSLESAAEVLAQQSYGGGWEGAGFGHRAGKGKDRDTGGMMRFGNKAGTYSFTKGPIAEDVFFVPRGPGQGGTGGGGGQVVFQPGSIVVHGAGGDPDEIADKVAEKIAKRLEEHFANQVEE